ncbi:MAG: glycosyltransferase family 4 protein [Gammaproteobacteria bacterium]
MVAEVIILLFSLSALAYLLVFSYKQFALSKGIVDTPNLRSHHTRPIPLGGGAVFACVWLLACFGAIVLTDWSYSYFFLFLPGSVMILSISFIDDLYKISAWTRLAVHLLVATTLVYAIGGFPQLSLGTHYLYLGGVGSLLAIVAIAWSINLYNFMDGVDGIASMQAIFIFSMGSLFFWLSGANYLMLINLFLVATMIGFIILNWPPAKIYMGDVGSTFLGFLVAAFALIGEKQYGLPALIWLIIYGVFAFDATITLLRRMMAGEKWYKPHYSYFYHHRLLLLGWSHTKILLAVSAINCILGSLAFYAFMNPQNLIVCVTIALALLSFFYLKLERKQPMFAKPKSGR